MRLQYTLVTTFLTIKNLIPHTNFVELIYVSILTATLSSTLAAGMENVKPVSKCSWLDIIIPIPPISLMYFGVACLHSTIFPFTLLSSKPP